MERYGAEWQRDHAWEFERQEYYDYEPEPEKMWCRDCKEVVDAVVIDEYEHMDGRSYHSATYFECPKDKNHWLEVIRKCPICGEEMGESDEYCPSCMDEANQWLTEMRDGMKVDQNTFEDIVCKVLDI